MFPTQVSDWQTRAARRLAADRQGLVVRRHRQPDPGAAALAGGPAGRASRALDGASIVRYAQDGVLVVSRIDPATARRSSSASTTARPPRASRSPTATPGATLGRRLRLGNGDRRTDADHSCGLRGRGRAEHARCRRRRSPRPTLVGKPDALTSLYLLAGTVQGAPASVTFAIRARGGAWRRVASTTRPRTARSSSLPASRSGRASTLSPSRAAPTAPSRSRNSSPSSRIPDPP